MELLAVGPATAVFWIVSSKTVRPVALMAASTECVGGMHANLAKPSPLRQYYLWIEQAGAALTGISFPCPRDCLPYNVGTFGRKGFASKLTLVNVSPADLV
jgi:hypothetical protein